MGQCGLRGRVFSAAKDVSREGAVQFFCDATRNRVALIEASLASTSPMQRDRNDQVRRGRLGSALFTSELVREFVGKEFDRESEAERRSRKRVETLEPGDPILYGPLVADEGATSVKCGSLGIASGAGRIPFVSRPFEFET